MTYAMFVGCNIPARLKQYEDATVAVLNTLAVEFTEIPEFNCCGYPARHVNRDAFVFSAARNLALAEKSGHDMLVLCKCCYGNLKSAQHLIDSDGAMKKRVETILSKEGLSYTGSVRVRHLLSVLYEDVGVETLKNHISRAFQNLSIAASHGCHALRPSDVTRFDNPVSPVIFDQLVAVTGASSVDWSKKTDCCGAPLLGINDTLSIEMMKRKVSSAKAAGAHYLCTACPFSHIQFDTVQKQFCENNGNQKPMAPILYPQLLGLAMGIDAKHLGVEKSQLDISDIHLFLS